MAPASFAPTDGAGLALAIATADSNTDASNTIMLAAGTYSLPAEPTGVSLTIADLAAKVPAKTFVFKGAGSGQTTIDASQSGDRAFQIVGAAGAAVIVIIQDVTISGGKAHDGGVVAGAVALGGCLLIDAASVSLVGVTLSNDKAQAAAAPVIDPTGLSEPGADGGAGLDAQGGPSTSPAVR